MSKITKPIVLNETFASKMDTANGHASTQATNLGTIGTNVAAQTAELNTKLQALNELLEAKNHLDAHRNTALDLLSADARAAVLTDFDTLVELIQNNELSEIMDYGDQIAPAWADGETNYTPAFNLVHFEDAILEDQESIPVAIFEMDKVLPFGTQLDAPEAIYYFAGTEAAGTYHIGIGSAYGDGWAVTKSIQFTLNVAPAEGDQLVISCGENNANDPTNGRTWNLYAKGSTVSKDTGTTSNGTGGTSLGTTSTVNAHTVNGRVNAISRVVYGYGRWSQSGIRQYLNSAAAAGNWWTAQNDWDRPCNYAATKAGFLAGLDAGVASHIRACKNVTVACDADGNAEDVTYDKVFLGSLEQTYINPQFGSGKEGVYWEYYKRLLGRTSPAAQGSTYSRLIKYDLAAGSAQYRWLRSVHRGHATTAWSVHSSGSVYSSHASSGSRCAPCLRIG